jgi:hypothetical protein
MLAGEVLALLSPSSEEPGDEPERGQDDALPARVRERDFSRL